METTARFQPDILNGFEEQDDNGVDLSHLRANLRLTPTERLKRHRRVHQLWMEVERAAALAGLRHNLELQALRKLTQGGEA